ncbi:MAG: thioredoxin domain-containing protein [Chthoniobacterales bacterium]|nr:thioredoxin domain-containing protein [Chthoniobacterales bacterium]
MKRYLPFLIIIAVALITAATGLWLYKTKMRPAPRREATAANSLPQKEEGKLGGPHVRGAVNAPLTLEIYGDFQCPPCATTTVVIDELQQEYGQRMRLIFHEFPLAMHAHALAAAMAAEAAGAQGHFWDMHDMLYRYQAVWSKASNPERLFRAYAESFGLDMAKFEAAAKSDETRERIMAEGSAGAARGVVNTPTIFINGEVARGGFTQDNLKTALATALSAKPKN